MTREATGKLMILGLDGATFDVIEPMVTAGELPGFARLMSEGSWGVLKSTIPPLTPPAWSTISTGVNPGKHGLFEFQKVTADHRLVFNSSLDKRAPDLWDYLPDRKVIIAHLPFSYPPRKVNGILISGMMTPGMDAHHTEPLSIEREINARFPDYAFLISWQKYLGREDIFLERITSLFDQRLAMLDYLMEHEWDLLLFVLMEIDSAQHCFWGTDVIEELYRKADALVSRLLDRADAGEFDLVVISDHGFARVDKWIHVNSLLADVGYLAFKSAISAPKARLEGLVAGLSNRIMKTSVMKAVMAHVSDEAVESVFKAFGKGKFEKRNEPCPFDWSRTVAFMTSYYGCIYLDRESVFEGGTVSEEDAAGLKAAISSALMSIRDPETGEKVIKDVLDAREVYTGPHTAHAPDLLAIPAPGYAFSPMRSKRTIQRNNFLSGEHNPDGVFMAYGPDISVGRLSGLWVGDVAPTALHAMGAGIPDDMDGSVLVEAFRQGSEPREREPRRYHMETPLSVKSRIDRLKQEGKL